MSIAGITAGKAFIELGVDDSGLVKGINNVKGVLDKFDSGVRDVVQLSAAFKQAGGAAGIFNSILGFIAANPATVAIIAIVAALKAFNYVQAQASEAAERHTQACKNEADAAKKATQETEKRIDEETALMSRLEELNNKEKLLSFEQDEARDIVEKLTDRYGDLGIEIDSQTGKVYGLADAYKKLNKTQREQMRAAKQNEADTIFAQEAALRDQTIRDFVGNWSTESNDKLKGYMYAGDYESALNWARNDDYDEKTINRLKELIDLRNQMNAAQAEANKLGEEGEDGTGGAVTKGGIEARKKKYQATIKANEELAKMEEENRRSRLTETERQIDDEMKRKDEFYKQMKVAERNATENEKAELYRRWYVFNEEVNERIKKIKDEADAEERRVEQEKKLTAEKENQAKVEKVLEQIKGMKAKEALEKELETARNQAAAGDRASVEATMSKYTKNAVKARKWLDGYDAGTIEATPEEAEQMLKQLEHNKTVSSQLKAIASNTKATADSVKKTTSFAGGFSLSGVAAAGGYYTQQAKTATQVQQINQYIRNVFTYNP